MRSKEEILKDINSLEDKLKTLRDEYRKLSDVDEALIEEKIKRCYQSKDKFDPSELVFAANAHCECGAGLCYPKDIGVRGSWYCSGVLLNTATTQMHNSYPFAFYSIKSENQPSANGQTTRPKP